jgi:hypothetical protein
MTDEQYKEYFEQRKKGVTLLRDAILHLLHSGMERGNFADSMFFLAEECHRVLRMKKDEEVYEYLCKALDGLKLAHKPQPPLPDDVADAIAAGDNAKLEELSKKRRESLKREET